MLSHSIPTTTSVLIKTVYSVVIEAECILSGCGPLSSLAANDEGRYVVLFLTSSERSYYV